MKKILNFGSILFLLSLFAISSSNASDSYFIDFSKVLNQSTAGKNAQDYLKKKFKSETDKFVKSEKKLKEEEKQIISQRKIITKEEYKKKS
jgi:Skp family chaperone for outer membrane proteins